IVPQRIGEDVRTVEFLYYDVAISFDLIAIIEDSCISTQKGAVVAHTDVSDQLLILYRIPGKQSNVVSGFILNNRRICFRCVDLAGILTQYHTTGCSGQKEGPKPYNP